MKSVSPVKADLTLAFIAFLWGVTFLLVKNALVGVSATLFLAFRFTLAALILAVVFRRRIAQGFTREQWIAGAVTGTILMAGYILQTIGLHTTTPSKSAFLTGLYIVLVPFAGALVYRNVPHWIEAVGVLVAGVGMSLLSIPGLTTSGERLSVSRGDLLTIGCAALFALHMVMLGHYAPRVGFESISVLQVGFAALSAVLFTPIIENPFIHWQAPVVIAILVCGVLATAVAFLLQSWAQQYTTATHAALIFSLEPVFAWLVSWRWEGETLSFQAGCGALLILAGILVVELKPAFVNPHPSNQTPS
jgi:drug/metabolite transporter (DMT)-like permease